MLPVATALLTAILAQPLTPVRFTDVNFTGGFWAQRLAAVRDATLLANFHQCEITGRIDNFAAAAGANPGPFQGYFFNDSDVYKAIEGAAYVLATLPAGDQKSELDARLDAAIATIAAAQQPDGYINSYFTTLARDPAPKDTDTRWSNTAVKHEMYCIGHLIEAGVAHYQATGKRSLLDVALRAADHVDSTFGPPPKRPDVCGHEEIELALIRLWQLGAHNPGARIDRPERYLELARHFVNSRGQALNGRRLYGEYCQDHVPLREQTEVVGHAVRAMYLFSAATDLARLAGESTLGDPLERLWSDLVYRKMYVTGGIGNSGHNEGFTLPYDLPNDTAYAETCATIGLVLWNHRLNLLHGDAKYFDIAERALYNGVLSGLSLDGSKFFYENPLGSPPPGDHHRQDWFACACCPPNILRVLASVGGMMYAVGPDNTIRVNLYAASTATIPVRGGTVKVTQETDYPWGESVRLTVEPSSPELGYKIALRIPGWCRDPQFDPGGPDQDLGRAYARDLTIDASMRAPDGEVYRSRYFTIPSDWIRANSIQVTLPMRVQRIQAHPSLTFDRGRIALQRGPIVYCLEDADNHTERTGLARSIAIPPDAEVEAEFRADLLGGVTVLTGEGLALPAQDWDDDQLYRPVPEPKKVRFTAIPYFAWDNREAGGMQVWIPESTSLLPLGPLPGVTPSASHTNPTDTVAALTDRQVPTSSNDHQVPRHTWWSHRGTSEWAQLDFAQPRSLRGLDVYWFDDGPPGGGPGGGGCRVPASWTIQYREAPDGAWKPVNGLQPATLTTERDRFNSARFSPVMASAVRIQVQLREGYSGGILELKPVR